ncbi:MAG: cytochrome C oxidase subunit IV family protein [Chitinophagaceae bacterium]
MDQHAAHTSEEVTFHPEHTSGTKRIWKTFWILLIITMIELGLGLLMYAVPGMPYWIHLFIKGVISVLTLAKAFYIVSVFMHLGDEVRNLIMTVVVPLMLFIWFITAFLLDGNAFRNNRNKYDKHFREQMVDHQAPVKDTSVHVLD